MWLDNTWAQERGSGLYLAVQRSPFSFRAIQTTPHLSSARASWFTTEVKTYQSSCSCAVYVVCVVTSFHFFMQRWSLMTRALSFHQSSSAGAAPPTRPWWGAVCWPISVSLAMTLWALTSSPANGISPGATTRPPVWKVRWVILIYLYYFIIQIYTYLINTNNHVS